MQSLPDALAGLAAFPQFVLYRLVPSTKKPGKTDKLPVDWRTGHVVGVTDRTAWTTFDNASQQVANGRADGVGFVFSEADPFFFLDIDHALVDGQWSPLAQQLCAAFAGAGVEVSSSGTGLHIIGRGANAAPSGHRCKNVPLGLEFYTRERFVALTGAQTSGSVDTDLSHLVPWFLQHFIPQDGPNATAADEWTEAPRADWRGPTDDDDLIRRAMNSRSLGSVFGHGVTFADLWTRNADVLGAKWPDDTREFAESEADGALASHLAFWTGCDMARTERLMRMSALVRDKWDEGRRGETWLEMTIRRFSGPDRKVCQDKAPESPQAPAAAPTPTVGTPAPSAAPAGAFLRPEGQRALFAGCVYVLDQHRVLLPGGMMVKPEQFKTKFGGRVFILDDANEKTTRNAWEAFTESTVNACPIADSAWFRPALPPGSIDEHEGRRYVNSYFPAAVDAREGEIGPFLEHLRRVLPVERDRTILLAYMAACVQYPGVKFQWAPLLQGAEGNGKSLFSRCVEYSVGERYTHWPPAKNISTNFNAWLSGRIFIGVEDMFLPDDRGEVWEALKPMITNSRQSVEPKGVDQQSLHVCCNFILNSNHKDALKKTRGDRRIAPLYCAQQVDHDDDVKWIADCGMGGDYFPKLYSWLRSGGYAHVAYFLRTMAIPEEFNPATHCPRAPDTSSTEEAISLSLSRVEQEIKEAIEQGEPGFLGGWVSSMALSKLLDRIGKSRVLSPRKREQTLGTLGYIKHPSLTNGRVDNVVLPDSGKPVLWVKRGHPSISIPKPGDVARAYSLAQGCAFG